MASRIAVAGLLACVLLSSCVSTGPVLPAAPESYAAAEELFLRGEYAGARSGFESFVSRHPRSEYGPGAEYWAGVCALKLGDIEGARERFSRSLGSRRRSPFNGVAVAGLADCDFLAEKYESASSLYLRALEASGTPKDRMLYQLARCNTFLSGLSQAKRYYRQVVERFPDSKYAGLARERLERVEEQFSVQAGAFEKRKGAEKLRSRLGGKGFAAHIRVLVRGGNRLYCVCVGRFESWREASGMASRMKGAGFEARVIP